MDGKRSARSNAIWSDKTFGKLVARCRILNETYETVLQEFVLYSRIRQIHNGMSKCRILNNLQKDPTNNQRKKGNNTMCKNSSQCNSIDVFLSDEYKVPNELKKAMEDEIEYKRRK